MQSKIFSFLVKNGFSFREIGTLVGKKHETIRHTIKTYAPGELKVKSLKLKGDKTASVIPENRFSRRVVEPIENHLSGIQEQVIVGANNHSPEGGKSIPSISIMQTILLKTMP